MNGSNEQEQGATPSGSGCQPTASAAIASSQSGIPSAEYVIRKGGYYYRPNAAGYTSCIAQAGRYTLEEALRHSYPNGPEGPRDDMDYMLAPAAAAGASRIPNLSEFVVAIEGLLKLRAPDLLTNAERAHIINSAIDLLERVEAAGGTV